MRIKKHRTYAVVCFGILFLLLLSCAQIQEIANIQKPDVSIQKMRLTGLNFQQADLTFDVQIHNPNQLSATLAGFNYDFRLNDASVLTGSKNSELRIEALGNSTLEIPVSLQFDDLYQSYQSLKNRDSSQYKIQVGLTFNLPVLGKTHIPVSKQGYVPLLKFPSLDIAELKLNRLNLTSANLELLLDVNNPNGIGFSLKGFQYQFNINGNQWAEGTATEAIRIEKNSDSRIVIPIQLDFLKMGQTVYGIVSGNQNLNYQLQANMDLQSSIPAMGSVALPISKSGRLQISR